MSTSAPGRTSPATAKDARNGSPRSPRPSHVLRAWLAEPTASQSRCSRTAPARLSRDAVEKRLALHLATAASACPSLKPKTSPPHTLRHTAAMRLLHAGVDTAVIALWLGHDKPTRPRSTFTPTSTSRRKHSPGPPRRNTARALPAPGPLLAFLETL